MRYLILLTLLFSLQAAAYKYSTNEGGVAHSIPFDIDVAAGKVVGHSIVLKFGNNANIGTATVPEDIWASGGVYTGFPSGGAETVECFSSSANDAAAGTGARTIQLFPLDSSYAEPTSAVTLTLNGITAVATTGAYLRLNRIKVLTAGSGGVNAGVITCRHTTTTANVFATIPIGLNQTEIAAYTIPAGKTGYVKNIFVAVRDTKTTLVTGAVHIKDNAAGALTIVKRLFAASHDTPFDYSPYGGMPLTEKTDIILRVLTTSANSTDVTGRIDMLVIDN